MSVRGGSCQPGSVYSVTYIIYTYKLYRCMYALTFDVSRKGAPCSITSMIHITPKRKYKIQQLIHEETAWYADLREETCYDSSTGCVPKYHKPEPSRYIPIYHKSLLSESCFSTKYREIKCKFIWKLFVKIQTVALKPSIRLTG